MKSRREIIQAMRGLILRHQLLTAITLVIVVTAVLTSISMTLYIQSGASGLDLSRPGFSTARDDLQQDTNTTFKSTGSLTPKDIEAFTKLYEKQRAVLSSLSNFDDESLSDESLGLTLDAEPDSPQ